MFLATDHSNHANGLPESCTFTENDWHVLAGFWYPLVWSDEVADKPVCATLLDVRLVIYRTSQGVTVANDVCKHRGARLSSGWVRDDSLVCPMHGLHFSHGGACNRIPCMGDNARIPEKLNLETCNSVERYGMVWVCLKPEPTGIIPDWSVLEKGGDSGFFIHRIPNAFWNTSAGRHVENLHDIAHFPWVHNESFGGDYIQELPPYKVHKTEHGLMFRQEGIEVARYPDNDGNEAEESRVKYTYSPTFPFASNLRIEYLDLDQEFHYLDYAVPVSARKTKIFMLVATNNKYADGESLVPAEMKIISEDTVAVEGQEPKEIPLDLREEIHLPADRFSLEYRKGLAAYGLGAPAKQ